MNLNEVLKIVSKDELTRMMVVIEECGDVDEAYEELCVVYDPVISKADVISMINESKNELADKMIELLEKNPMQLFLMMRAEGTTYTEYFIEQCGGADAFLATYEPDRMLNELHGAMEEDNFDSVLQSAKAQESNKYTDAVAEITPDIKIPNITMPSVHAPESAEAIANLQRVLSSITELSENISNVSNRLDEAYTRVCNKEDTISAQYGSMRNVLNPDGTFVGFTKENMKEIADSIDSLNLQINLGNIDPDEILSVDEIKKASEYLEDFDPHIYKHFIMSIFSKSETQADRAYISGLMDRFYEYVKENV